MLEYRVWCSPHAGAEDLQDGSDYYYSFETYEAAVAYSKDLTGCKPPLALILQREFIDEPSPGEFAHVKRERVAEWPVAFLTRPKRTEETIPKFMSPDAPPNRLQILRGEEG